MLLAALGLAFERCNSISRPPQVARPYQRRLPSYSDTNNNTFANYDQDQMIK